MSRELLITANETSSNYEREENDTGSEDLNEELNLKPNFMPVVDFNIVNTNARSLIPKIDSFMEYLNELETSLAFLTET